LQYIARFEFVCEKRRRIGTTRVYFLFGARVSCRADPGDVTLLVDGFAVFVGLTALQGDTFVTDGASWFGESRLSRSAVHRRLLGSDFQHKRDAKEAQAPMCAKRPCLGIPGFWTVGIGVDVTELKMD
jgi:hypothetical protein